MDKEEIKNETGKEYRKRGYRSCVSAAIHDTANTLRHTTKRTLLCLAAAVVAMSALYTWMLTLIPGVMYVGFEFKGTQFAVCSALMAVLAFAVGASLFSAVNGKTAAWNILRGMKLIPVNLLFLILYALVGAGCCLAYLYTKQNMAEVKLTTLLEIYAMVSPLLFVFMLPMTYVNTKFMLEPETKIRKTFRRAYAAGFRSWGFTFATVFLAALCIFIADAILCLPAYISLLIENIAAYGTAAYGDATGLPTTFYAMSFAIFIFAVAVRISIQVFATHTAKYIYQTVEACAENRKRKKDNNKTTQAQ